MKLIIDIDEELYSHAKECSEDSNDEWNVMRALAKSKPLKADSIPLDKIRAEIEAEYQENDATRCEEYDDGYCLGLQTALNIIDKYTKEQE